jgi:hypothetical protein
MNDEINLSPESLEGDFLWIDSDGTVVESNLYSQGTDTGESFDLNALLDTTREGPLGRGEDFDFLSGLGVQALFDIYWRLLIYFGHRNS